MSHSLLTARPHTHIKIVVVALVGAIVIVLSGIAAHVNTNRTLAQMHARTPVVQATKAANYTGRVEPVIR
jgi:hypothetical protein